MDTAIILTFLQESLYLILVFCGFLVFAIVKGKQSLINVIMGLYFGLLLSLKFPYYDFIVSGTDGAKTQSVIMILFFIAFTVVSTLLFNRLMPREFDETAFEGFGKKALFALAATALVMAFSFHVLPVTEFLTPGTPIQYLFASEGSFFWWMIAPLGVLFLL